MKFYDIFDPDCYNNVFVFCYAFEPILLAGCYVPTSPEKRTVKVNSFYRWLCVFLKVYTKERWSLHPCNIKPGPHPFSVDITSASKESIQRDSTDLLSPGAYLILIDGTNHAPESSPDQLDSEALTTFPRGVPTAPSSIRASPFCNITGVPLSDGDRTVVPILQNRIEETRLVIFLGRYERLPADLGAPQNYLTMASSLRPHFDQYSFGIDVDDDYRIIQFSKPSPDLDISTAGVLKIPESQAMPYDNCLKLHLQFCIRMYLASPPPGTQAYSMDDVEDLQEAVGVYDGDESLPDLSNPVWNSPLGREVLRSIMARRVFAQPRIQMF